MYHQISIDSAIGLLLTIAVFPVGALTLNSQVSPVAIPDGTNTFVCIGLKGSPSTAITDLGVIADVDHTFIGDLTVELRGPGGTPVLTLLNRPGRTSSGLGSSTDISLIRFSDSATGGVSAEDIATCAFCTLIPAPDAADTPNAGVGSSLADFVGVDIEGIWELCVADSSTVDSGTFRSWSLVVNENFVPVELQSFSID